MITRGLVWRLGLSQLLCWGLSYYLIGVLGERIVAETGWSATLVYSGFSGALVVMGLASPLLGRFVDQHGGRPVMMAGSLLLAAGCVGLSLARDLVSYAAAWACLGLAMRMTLYEAAFAALARIGGASARRPIAQITLLGGLASTVFWPVGNALAEAFGWRGAALAYAGIALLTLPLHATIPDERHGSQLNCASVERKDAAPLTRSRGDRLLAGALYALIVSVAAFLNSGMSAHMIPILTGLGLSAGVAVWAATLRGVGQSLARLCEVLFGGRLDPLALGLLASSLLPVAFVAGLFGGASALAGAAFAFAYGVGNGLLTITRGTQPLVLFDPRTYGTLVGLLTAPAFFLSALAPVVYALVIERASEAAALYLSAGLAVLVFGASALLVQRFRP